ncbi:hypothetical protein ES288_A02G030100v1 [Gossypium darwinii]|uniref:GTD-binding domain-containing protein n=1 Tax=Gossypium darwinii TaxID=34276 RepID=A0A5D2HBN2_GOSDA|nr:hypothetical protein ES288_A02G030100v1 [Gossypium darwinii]
MACNVMNSWTFTGIVGAFLDLFIAYLYLCGSTLAYLASRFLGLFGLSLPCPCNGLFGYLEKKNRFQAMLVHDPCLKISPVQYAIMKRLPFDAIWNNFYDDGEDDDDDEQRDSQLNSDYWQDGKVEMEGEASSSSCNGKKNTFVGGGLKLVLGDARELIVFLVEKFHLLRMIHWFPLRHQLVSILLLLLLNLAKMLPKRVRLWFIPKVMIFYETFLWFFYYVNVTSNVFIVLYFLDGKETAKDIGGPKQNFQGSQMDYDSFAENKSVDEKEIAMVIKRSASVQDFDGGRVLGQALDAEHAACAALYIELEKERSAAATAADEAMAMILRLQEEKAAIEMEAKQYRRMIEAKFTYDAEEMNILKEILLRREKEKYFLEKETESYKQILYGKEQLDADMYDTAATEEQEMSSEWELLQVQQVNELFREKDKTKVNTDFVEGIAVTELNKAASFLSSSIENNDAHMFRSDDEINTMVEDKKQCNETNPNQHSALKTTEAKMIFPYINEKVEKLGKGLHRSDSGSGFHVLDVHVINNASNEKNKEGEKIIEKKLIGVSSNSPKACDNQTPGWVEIESGRKGNSLERSEGLPPIHPSQPKYLHRKSKSAFDYERLKIDNEVGWLRERLKIVQLGREKLNFPAGQKGREQVELQIMEDIATQLRDRQQLTESGKALPQAPLPPPSSKVMSKKRHKQSASLGGLGSI